MLIAGYDVDSLRKHILQLTGVYPENEELLIDTISPGSAGCYQVEEAGEFFGIDVEAEQEFAWDEVDAAASKLEDQLNALLDLENVFLYFGHWEADGTYGLIAVISQESLAQG